MQTTTSQEISSFPLLQFHALFFFSLDVGGDGFEELQQVRAKAQKNNGTCEVEGAPIHFFFCCRKVMFSNWARGEVLVMAEIAPGLGNWGGLSDGRGRSRVGLVERSRQWPRSLLDQLVEEVLVMVKIILGPSCKGGFNDGQGRSRTGLARRSR